MAKRELKVRGRQILKCDCGRVSYEVSADTRRVYCWKCVQEKGCNAFKDNHNETPKEEEKAERESISTEKPVDKKPSTPLGPPPSAKKKRGRPRKNSV